MGPIRGKGKTLHFSKGRRWKKEKVGPVLIRSSRERRRRKRKRTETYAEVAGESAPLPAS